MRRWAELLRNADLLLVKLGIPLAFLLIVAGILRPSATYLLIGILLLLSCPFWLRIRNCFVIERVNERGHRGYFLILASTFFFLFSYSLIILYNRSMVYERPIGFFVLISIMSGILALETSFLPSRKYSFLVLAQVIILGLGLSTSQMTLYPNVIGVDPWYHQSFVEAIINWGNIPPGVLYSALPMFHLSITIPMQVMDIDYKLASILSISAILVVVNVLTTYCLGRHFFNEKVGLMAALLLTISNYHINMSLMPIPNYFGFILIIVLVYLLVKFWKDKPPALFGLVALLMSVIIMTHVLAAVFTTIVLLSWSIASIIFSKSGNGVTPKYILPITVAFLVVSFIWLTFTTGYGQILVDYIQSGLNIDYFSRVPDPTTEFMHDYLSKIPLEQRLFEQLGIYICSIFALIGYLYMVSKKRDDLSIYAFAMSGIAIVIIPFTSTIVGISVLGERWFAFAQIMGAIPLTVAILSIIRLPKKKRVRTIALATLTIILTLAMILSPTANIDSPILSSHTSVKPAYTTSELTAAIYALEHTNKAISSDWDFASRPTSVMITFAGIEPSRITPFDSSLLTQNFSRDGRTIIIRDEISHNPIAIWGATYRLDYDPGAVLSGEGFNLVYSNTEVRMYT